MFYFFIAKTILEAILLRTSEKIIQATHTNSQIKFFFFRMFLHKYFRPSLKRKSRHQNKDISL